MYHLQPTKIISILKRFVPQLADPHSSSPSKNFKTLKRNLEIFAWT